MAVLTNADFTAYKHALRNDKVAATEIRDLELSKATLKATFQALEDGYVSRNAAIKAEVDAAAGVTLTNSVAKTIEDLWGARRAGAI